MILVCQMDMIFRRMIWLPSLLAKLLSMLFTPISSFINRSGGTIHVDIDIDRPSPSQQKQPCAYQNSQVIDLSLKAELPKFRRPKYYGLPANDEELFKRACERMFRIRKDTRPNSNLFDITTIRGKLSLCDYDHDHSVLLSEDRKFLLQLFNNLLLLPDDIVMDILSRLNITSSLYCQSLSKRLCELMSTPLFTAMQANRSTPILVVQNVHGYAMKHCFFTNLDKYQMFLEVIDEGNNQVLTRITNIHMTHLPEFYGPRPHLIGSYNGLLVFKHILDGVLRVFIIVNPVTKEQVLVTPPAPSDQYELCGLYFHTPTSEYRMLFMFQLINELLLPNKLQLLYEPCRFFVLSLKNKLLREISNHTEVPCTYRPPIILNGALYWMASVGGQTRCNSRESSDCSKSILVFKMDSEEFITMPHPGRQCSSKERHRTEMQLLEMEGYLCLCDISLQPSAEVHVWVLEDFMKQVWIRRHIVNIQSLTKHIYMPDDHWRAYVQALQIHNNELVLRKGDNDLFYFHLRLKTFRKVEMGNYSDTIITVVAHTNSLVSLHT